MKSIKHMNKSRDKVLHIEADGCIINITVGLTDSTGRKVTHVEVRADQFAGEPAWKIDTKAPRTNDSDYLAARVIQDKA